MRPKKKMLLILVAILLIPLKIFYTCFNNKCAEAHIRIISENKHILLVQGICYNDLLASTTNLLNKLVDTIVKDELSAHGVIINDTSAVQAFEYNDYHFFLPKERQRLTFYYINDFNDDYLIIVPQELEKLIRKNRENFFVRQATITSDLRFFGERKDELVSIIADPKKELTFLHTLIKNSMHDLHKSCAELYDIQKSEQFDYIPHIGLGRIRVSIIKTLLKERRDSQDSDTVFESIMERIRKETLAILKEELQTRSPQIHFTSIAILNLKTKKYIAEIPLVMKDHR